jgi:hypothetical protein
MLPHLPREPEGGAMTSADRTACELVIGDRLEYDITDADGFLRLAAAIEAAPEAVALSLADELRRFVASARDSTGLCPGCVGEPLEICPYGVVAREWEADARSSPRRRRPPSQPSTRR